MFARSRDDHLLLLEHPHVYTLGVRADPNHVLVDPATVGVELLRTDRGGDVTYHGPGQLVGYPVLSVPGKRGGGMADTVAYVHAVEQLVIDALTHLGLDDVGRLDRHPGVWVAPSSAEPRKIAAIGVRLSRGRSMHGFALNVDPDLSYFDHIVPCGILDKGVTSLVAEGVETSMRAVVDVVAELAVAQWAPDGRPWERADAVWRTRPSDLSAFTRGEGPGTPGGSRPESVRLLGRLATAGVTGGIEITQRKPDWMRAPLKIESEYRDLEHTLRDLDLVTVCEEAGCPNRSECWRDGTATFMLNGDCCTRACGFCLVDTRHPQPVEADEADRVAEAVVRLGLEFAVLTAVARDDLPDGGSSGFAASIRAIRERSPRTGIEVLIPDCKGDPESLAIIFDERPEVLNHNIETVLRLQQAVRPSAAYARSLAVLARAKDSDLVTKSGIIVGMGEAVDEVVATLADLAGVGVDIVTVGQYLRPTSNHLPVARWWTPEEFDELAAAGRALGIGHVEASPFTRSSYHAKQAAGVSIRN